MCDTWSTFWVCLAFAITRDDWQQNVDLLILSIRKIYTDLGFLTEDLRKPKHFPSYLTTMSLPLANIVQNAGSFGLWVPSF